MSGQNAQAPVDVVALLRDMQRKHEGGYPLPSFGPVIDAVAELIEADREYDEAKAAWDYLPGWGDNRRDYLAPESVRYEAAIQRRAAARARVGGAS